MAEEKSHTRPSIVVILGHVDHGKSTLLDAIRNTNDTSREAGGITQSIGAWQVETKTGQKFVFIDTPGHEAFSGMRSRGAKLADLGILVVSADDGVMPQTRESLQYLRDTNTPFLVAITKTDLPSAQPQVVRDQLVQEGVSLEGQGGDIVAVPVSARENRGIDELLEMISLVWQLQGEKSDPNARVEAAVVETGLDRRRGPVASVVVRNGILRVGDQIGTEDGSVSTKVRGLFDQGQNPVKEVGPGTPAQVLGFEKLPPVGSILTRSSTITVVETKRAEVTSSPARNVESGRFGVIIKADTTGSLEAIVGQLGEKVVVVYGGVGDIAESDVMLAGSARVSIVGFNVRMSKEVGRLAEEEGVQVWLYKIIYELLQDVEKWQREKEEMASEKILGRAALIAQFPHSKRERIAGSRVESGRITKSDKLRLVREGTVLGNIRALSFKKHKAEVDAVSSGEEFGILFDPQLDFRLGDVIESYVPKNVGAAPAGK